MFEYLWSASRVFSQAVNRRSASEGGSWTRSNSRSFSASPVTHFNRSFNLFALIFVQIFSILGAGSVRSPHFFNPFPLHGEQRLFGSLSSLSHWMKLDNVSNPALEPSAPFYFSYMIHTRIWPPFQFWIHPSELYFYTH